MKFRQLRSVAEEGQERELEAEVRRLAASEPAPPAPPDTYWANLIIRTNERIDDATSGKALSLSWAFRVAIPGVVAILSFLVGLHYYAPESSQRSSLEAIVLSMPAQAADSLVDNPERVDPSLSIEEVIATDPLAVPREEAAEYYIDNERSTTLMESMSDEQVTQVLSVLGSKTNE